MTTVAYRDGILAVDRQGNWGDIIEKTDNKIRLFENKETAIAICGNFINAFHFMDWYRDWDGLDGTFVPLDDDRRGGFTACIVQRKHVDEIHADCWNQFGYPISVNEPYDAWGMGAECALGAMYAGADAIDAVMAGGKHLSHSGFGCRYVDFNRKTLIVHTREREYE